MRTSDTLSLSESSTSIVLPLTSLTQATILLNCVGPYRFYGEQVVKACVEAGTHYLDITGEPEFIERMQLKYHDDAAKKVRPCFRCTDRRFAP